MMDKLKAWIKLNIYNPFSINIYYSGERGYVVRRLTWIGWEHLDKDVASSFWWTEDKYRDKYCLLPSYERAVQRIEEYNTIIEDKKFVRVTKEQL